MTRNKHKTRAVAVPHTEEFESRMRRAEIRKQTYDEIYQKLKPYLVTRNRDEWGISISREAFLKAFTLRAFPERIESSTISTNDLLDTAIQFVKNNMIFSSTHPKITEESYLCGDIHLSKFLWQAFGELGRTIAESFEEMSQIALCLSFGNCGERAMVAAQFLKKNGIKTELFALVGHHVFAVINRDPATNPSDFSSWNADTIILDLLLEEYFPVSDIKEKILDVYLGDRGRPSTIEIWTTVEAELPLHSIVAATQRAIDSQDTLSTSAPVPAAAVSLPLPSLSSRGAFFGERPIIDRNVPTADSLSQVDPQDNTVSLQ